MSLPLRAGVIGAGFIGAVHADAVRALGGRITRAAGSSPESSRLAAELLGAEQASASADDLLTDPEVDVVHVCTPNNLHLEHALRALEAGKHVICEKRSPRRWRTQDGSPVLRTAADWSMRFRSFTGSTRPSARRAPGSPRAAPGRSG